MLVFVAKQNREHLLQKILEDIVTAFFLIGFIGYFSFASRFMFHDTSNS